MAVIRCFSCADIVPAGEEVCGKCYVITEDTMARSKSTEAFLYRTNGSIDIVRPSDGKHFALDELQRHVGGYVEVKKYAPRWVAVFNEDGRLKELPPNLSASDRVGFELVGDVLFVPERCMA